MAGVGTTHDIRIGANYFLLRPGSYTKRAAPLFGARFATGDPDYNNLSFWQHWAQTCWVGGFGAPTWQDDAMFDEGVGIDASQHEVMLLARDLGPADRTTGNWDLTETDGPRERVFAVFNGKLYCLSFGDTDLTPPSRLFGFNPGTSTWSLVHDFTGLYTYCMVEFGGSLVFGTSGTTFAKMSTAEAFTTFAKPAGETDGANTLSVYRGKLYAGLGREIYRYLNTFALDGSTAFYTIEDANYVYASEVHLGFLYFVSQNGHILRTDGNNTFDLWSFEQFVAITALRSFDGRLFVGAKEPLDGTDLWQAVLYQFSGSAVTELKRWGKAGYNISPGRLRVIGHSLWFGAARVLGMGTVDGFGIARYDPVEDAYHLFASNLDSVTYSAGTGGVNLLVDDVIYWNGYIYCSVRGFGIFRTKFTYSDASRALATYDTTPAGGSVAALNGGWFTSSDFDAGTPGLLKLWNGLTVHVDLPNSACSVYCEYSVDGGATWVNIGSVTKTGAATRYAKVFVLNDNGSPVGPLKATRFKYRLTLRTTNTAYSPQLRGVIVRYLPIPDPNWVWDVVVVLSDTQELLDGTIETPDNAAKLTALETAFRDGTLVEFQDADGQVWAGAGQPGVLIMDMVEQVPHIGASSDGSLEREVRLTLHEAVEGY